MKIEDLKDYLEDVDPGGTQFANDPDGILEMIPSENRVATDSIGEFQAVGAEYDNAGEVAALLVWNSLAEGSKWQLRHPHPEEDWDKTLRVSGVL